MASPRRKKSRLIPLAEGLKGVIEKSRTFADLDLLQVWRLWPQVVGADVAEHARPAAFRNGRLVVFVDSTVWSQELQFFKGQIIEQINDNLGQPVLREIRFQVGRVSPDD